MTNLPVFALILGSLGAILSVIATIRGQLTGSKESQLALAWKMQEKQLDMLVEENKDLRTRVRHSEQEQIKLRDDHKQCMEIKRLLEIQIEVLKQRGI
jgi:hypothetical protein